MGKLSTYISWVDILVAPPRARALLVVPKVLRTPHGHVERKKGLK